MPWGNGTRGGSTRQRRLERATIVTTWPRCYLNLPGCTTISTEDDHLIPLHQGGTHALANRRGACHHCHTIKTQREAAAARQPRKPSKQHPGLLPGDHPPTNPPAGHRTV